MGPDRVCKLLCARGSEGWRRWAPKVHEYELRAYERAHLQQDLSPHVAICYGSVHVDAVLDDEGADCSGRYLLQTGLVLERLEGPEEKAADLPFQKYRHVYRLLNRLEEVGVDGGDASVFNYARPETTKFIDVTTRAGARLLAEI